MNIFDRYIFNATAVATILICTTLIIVVFLTQSIRFLELILESGASGFTFWLLTALAIPRFFEIILPFSLMAGIIFVYNRMSNDSELTVMRAIGQNPIHLARPVFLLSILVMLFLLVNALWVAPQAVANMQQMRQMIKAQFSTSLFREGVFNQIGTGLMVYVRARADDGTLLGVMIHDNRNTAEPASTIIAERGALILADDGYQVLVYDGSRQQYDAEKKTLQRLNFNSYSLQLPENDPIGQRWREPEERTIFDLLNPDMQLARDVESLRDFKVELHRRIISPFFAIVFSLVTCVAFLTGSIERRGRSLRIFIAIAAAFAIQTLFVSCYNLARQSDAGLVFMWFLLILPFIACIIALTYGSLSLKNLRQHNLKKIAEN